MRNYGTMDEKSAKWLLSAIVLGTIASQTVCDAFTIQQLSTTTIRPSVSYELVSSSTTQLQAVLLPPMIIAPMIKKMREENAKRRMPTAADRDEADVEAPGLRVGRAVWKWPQYWPYDDTIFRAKKIIETEIAAEKNKQQPSVNDMVTALSGVTPLPTAAPEETEQVEDEIAFDPIQYWSNEEGNARTGLDPETIEKLRAHYEFYLQPGCSILEFGAAEDSYLPANLNPSRHVGVGAAAKLMNDNPSLTEKLIIDLNKVVPGRDIDSDELRKLASTTEQFDAIIMANTVDYLSYPREVFRTAWYLLKPGGIMIVPFSGRDVFKGQFENAKTKVWIDYSDDQHLWITGSFFQFSAGDGWENLLGFDISPESAKKPADNPIAGLLDRGKNNQLFVVQATKGFQYQAVDPSALEESISSLCWMLPVMEERDKSLAIPRLARIYETCNNDATRNAIERNLQYLPAIYEALVKMDTFAFTFSMQAQLAAELVSNPDFDGNNEEQLLNLKQGLGLRTPSVDFWIPIGQNTGEMAYEDRINLLGYLVPKFGSTNKLQTIALQAFVDGLVPTFNLIKAKCPTLSTGDIQLLGTELLATEILTVGRTTPKDFAIWLDCLTSSELEDILQGRKRLRELATTDYEAFCVAKEQEKERIEEYKRKYEDQVATARQERSLIFNPRTQKMQVFDNPSKKKEDGGNVFTKLFAGQQKKD